MSFSSYRLFIPALFGCGVLLACGGDPQQDGERADPAQLGGKADVPAWIQHIPVDFPCDATVGGTFGGWDSAHMYSFAGKEGYRYRFTLAGKWPWYRGAVIALYDAETGARVAISHARWDNDVELLFDTPRSVKYLVAVYSVTWWAVGDYALSVDCEVARHCVTYETTDAGGAPLRNFYAINVDSYEEGKQLLAQVANFVGEQIEPGGCAEQLLACAKVYKPVCGELGDGKSETFGNVCELKGAVRQLAGNDGEHKAHWEPGACDAEGQFCGGIAGIPCPAGYRCVLDGAYPDAGGSCHQIVCTYGGKGYLAGETFPASDGCNTCTCTAGGSVACTEMACVCDPAKEWQRDYKVEDPDKCATVKFTCPANTTYFANDCGCGCEQDPSCPQWVNCMPPTPCDVQAIKAKCPYTQIAW